MAPNSQPAPMPGPSGRARLVTVLASLTVLIPVILGRLVELIYKGTNPRGIDVTQGLAYLSEILAITFTGLGVWVLFVALAIAWLYRKEGARVATVPTIVFGVQIVGFLALAAVQGAVDGIVKPAG